MSDGISSSRKKISFEGKTVPIAAMLSGVGIALAITCAVFIGYALLITYTSVTEKHTPLVVIITAIISVIIAGFDTAKAAKGRGWFWGMFSGLTYALLLFVISALISQDASFSTNTITMIIIALAGGGLGGMLGINFKK